MSDLLERVHRDIGEMLVEGMLEPEFIIEESIRDTPCGRISVFVLINNTGNGSWREEILASLPSGDDVIQTWQISEETLREAAYRVLLNRGFHRQDYGIEFRPAPGNVLWADLSRRP